MANPCRLNWGKSRYRSNWRWLHLLRENARISQNERANPTLKQRHCNRVQRNARKAHYSPKKVQRQPPDVPTANDKMRNCTIRNRIAKQKKQTLDLPHHRWEQMVTNALSNLSTHEILQFAMPIALCCNLHRNPNQCVHRWNSTLIKWNVSSRETWRQYYNTQSHGPLAPYENAQNTPPQQRKNKSIAVESGAGVEREIFPISRSTCFKQTQMILPQVHLRKPCYDFSFL